MLNKVIDFFRPPEYDNIERSQKARFLHIALLVATVSCLLLGAQNMAGNNSLGTSLFVVAVLCFLCLPVNKRGYYRPVALFISALMLALITFSLVAGMSLEDAGLAAYPIFIIFASYLFSKRSVLITTLISVASIVVVYYMDRAGLIHQPVYNITNQLVAIVVLLPMAGFLLWVVVDNWERAMQSLRETYDETLAGWSRALEFRDRETEGHSQRVVEMTVALAKQLGTSPRELDAIRRGALLHDIGKMAVPDAILQKKGSLTDEEWAVVRKHPVQARAMLEHIPFLKSALVIPYGHHERWDGSGYPQGLSGEAIPFAARLFSVVDVWDALTSDRPYRPAWTEAQARQYLQDQAGKLFDPLVVRAFLGYLGKTQSHPAA